VASGSVLIYTYQKIRLLLPDWSQKVSFILTGHGDTWWFMKEIQQVFFSFSSLSSTKKNLA